MINLLKIIFRLLILLVIYTTIIYIFPIVGDKIDDITGTNINTNLKIKVESLLDKINNAKNSTNNYIDSVGENSKNKHLEQTKNIIEIQNQ